MNLADCYRLLGLQSDASFDAIKASYRRLARQYHPDVNPENQGAKEKFIEVTAAYKYLITNLLPGRMAATGQPATEMGRSPIQAGSVPQTTAPTSVSVKVTRREPSIQVNPNLSPEEVRLKTSSYQQLQDLLKQHRYPRAITLVEGLARRIPQDPEITQWQAIAYQRWGRHLIRDRQIAKARLYLKKALKTDPHNRSLWAEVEKDFRQIEQCLRDCL